MREQCWAGSTTLQEESPRGPERGERSTRTPTCAAARVRRCGAPLGARRGDVPRDAR